MDKILILSTKLLNKKNTGKLSRKINKSTPNFLNNNEINKTSGYYQKLYLEKPKYNNNNSVRNDKVPKYKKISLQKVFKKPNFPKPKFQFRKITSAKSPFSRKEKEPREVILEKLKLAKPSKLFHNFINIQWLRRKFPESVINKSIYTLLPNNGKPVIPDDESEEDKRHRLMIEFLESMKAPSGREQYININPKYFFNKQTWETVLKLKQIFLDFDADGNRRMELDEMQEMFESNKIYASINDLVDLFFKGKKFKESEIMKLYLNFHQFINFALTKDQEFREFMRNIRDKSNKEKEEKNNTKNQNSLQSENSGGEEQGENDEEKGKYLPMNFKSLLDYFVDRGKQRDSKDVINKAIKEMNEIINKKSNQGKYKNKQSKQNEKQNSINIEKRNNSQKNVKIYEEESKSSNSSSNKMPITRRKTLFVQKSVVPSQIKTIIKGLRNIGKSNRKTSEEELDNIELDLNEDDDLKIDYEQQLKEIDFNKLINEFSNLFTMSQIPKKKIKKKEYNNLKIQKDNKKEEENKEQVANKEDKNIKILTKSASQGILNSMSTLTKDNTINNLGKTKKILKSDVLNNILTNKNKSLSITDFKLIDKNIKLPSSHSYFNRNIKNADNKNSYYSKINILSNSKNSFTNSKFPRLIEEFSDNHKSISKINGYMEKDKLPILKYYSTKNKNNSFNCTGINLKNRKKFIFPTSKYEIRENQIKKTGLNLYGGKINLFKNDINIKIPKSNSKLDYVPYGLLFNNRANILQKEIIDQ